MKNSIINNMLKNSPILLKELSERLYLKMTEVVNPEWQEAFNSLTKQDCYDYIYNLTINRTFDGYRTEVETIYGQLEDAVNMKIEPAPDRWDRVYCVDFYIQVGENYIGIQIKPIESGLALNQYQWIEMHKVSHENFKKKFGGDVFFVYSTKIGGKKKIYNTEIINKINSEIKRLKNIKK
ncbi:MAG: MjaI family restriction endonuclease [Alphaproteobacteria bacterium]|nr:MjaI family restriction endonuclease [Alphaproteobacteria bacterium]